MRLLIVLLAFIVCQIAWADGFSSSSRPNDLKGKTIVEIGDVEKITSPSPRGFEVRKDIFKINDICFTLNSYTSLGFGKKAGLLFEDVGNSYKLVILDPSAGSVDLKIESVSVVQCPDGRFNIPRSSTFETNPSGSSNACTMVDTYKATMNRELLWNLCTLNFGVRDCSRCF